MTRPRRIGLPWYAPENYDALRASLLDGARLPPAYETWRIATEQMEREVQRSGVRGRARADRAGRVRPVVRPRRRTAGRRRPIPLCRRVPRPDG